jgi:Tfp pilus assembly protein PilX
MLTMGNYSKQSGVAMFTSLIILLLMSIIVLHAARSSSLEITIGNNAQHSAEALMKAEDAAVVAETFIEANYPGAPTVDFTAVDDDGLYLDGEIDVNTMDWYAFGAERVGEGDDFHEYIIEYLGPFAPFGSSLSVGGGGGLGTIYLYRVSGRGASSRGGTRVVQTIYAMTE